MIREYQVNSELYNVEVKKKGESLTLLGHTFECLVRGPNKLILRDEQGRQKEVLVGQNQYCLDGRWYKVQSAQDVVNLTEPTEDAMRAPMPGKVFKVMAKEGQRVSQGETLLVLEAMKMEHSIKAAYDGVLKKIFYSEGDQVEADAELVELEPTS